MDDKNVVLSVLKEMLEQADMMVYASPHVVQCLYKSLWIIDKCGACNKSMSLFVGEKSEDRDGPHCRRFSQRRCSKCKWRNSVVISWLSSNPSRYQTHVIKISDWSNPKYDPSILAAELIEHYNEADLA